MWPFLFLLATLPPDPVHVRLDANGWTETAAAELGPQESMWRWSATCAPQKLRGAVKPECAATERLLVRLADAKGHAAANTRIVWGTEAMLRDLPDDALPSAVTDANGAVNLDVAAKTALRLRAAGPEWATPWRLVTAAERAPLRLTASPAVAVHPRL